MKKLLFILSAILVSAITYGASLNPYAYNLSSTWNEETQELTVRFTLNAHPNMKLNPDGTINPDGGQNSGQGIQIFAIDPDTKEQYYIYGIPGSYINERKLAGSYDYEYTVPIDGMSKDADVSKRRPLPAGKNLTWGVVVQGKNRTDQSEPIIVNDNIANRPYSPHGIAVNNDQNSPDFGSIYVTECTDGVSGNATWGWLASSKGRSLLKYDPALKFQTSYRKHKDGDPNSELFSLRNANNLLEPHRVRISDDGRIFVSSYNKNTSSGKPLVWELNKTTGKFTPIIYNNTSYGHRVYGMDVKGSGSGIKILLCILLESTSNSSSKFQVYEYSLNSLGNDKNTGTKLFQYMPGSTNQTVLTSCIDNKYFHYTDGLVNVRYGSANRSDIFFGLDFFYNSSVATTLVYYPSGAYGSPKYFNRTGDGHYYGGAGFVPYVDKNTKTERVAMGRCYQRTGNENDGRLQVYEIADIKNENENATPPYTKTINTRSIVNDIAMDCAHNIYAVSFTDGTTGNGTGRLIAIAMPYDGKTTTIAPTTNENNYFNIKPVPNILATDLTYAPYGNENKYEFSFNVNTKPELAQIRFYANEADMLANNENYSFYYQFSDSELKQGRMSVIFDAVGGTIGDDKLLNDPNGNGLLNLPRGEYYWNVYVKTRKSCAFAPIYTQPAVGASDYHRQHATVDNNPDNKGFGHIYVADHHNIEDPNNRIHYVRAYTIGNATGNAQLDNQNNINDNTRYTTHWQVRNTTAEYMRRPAVAPDGMIYITDEGANNKNIKNDITYGFEGAGMWVLDPNNQTNDGIADWNTPNFSTKTPNQEVTTAASFLKKDGKWYLYKTNTYEEVTHHGPNGTNDLTSNTKWQANGYRIYTLTTAANGALVHSGYNDAQSVAKPFGGGNDTYKCGDTGGQFSILATENGVWMCQHREGKVVADDSQENPDGKNGVALSFFNHSGTRTFTSTAQSALTQKTTSILQSTPGAGMAYQKRGGVEYLYLVNHAGNILEFKITGGATPTLTHTQTYVTGNGTKGVKYGAISSMNFDYAGNLVVTAGATYGVTNGVRDHQELVIYTMPYPNQENARAIPAPKSCRRLPERIAYLGMDNLELQNIIRSHAGHGGCFIDFFRPLQAGMFNTICLPFNLNLKDLPETNPLFNAIGKEFSAVTLMDMNGEKVLCLEFTDVTNLQAYTPYLIEPSENITDVIRFDDPIELTSSDGNIPPEGAINIDGHVNTKTFNDNSIDFKGVVPITPLEATYAEDGTPLKLLLVADNRLAALTSNANILGFRAYFQLAKPLPAGTSARIVGKKPVTTNTTIVVDGKKVNVDKFLREGRVYIRVGETLYNITGDKVMR